MKTARYAITFGLQGCYMPDSNDGPQDFRTRAELAEYIRDSLDRYDMPKRLFDDVNIRRLWGFIQRHGSSTAHFHLAHKGYVLSFSGLTLDEYRQMVDAEELA